MLEKNYRANKSAVPAMIRIIEILVNAIVLLMIPEGAIVGFGVETVFVGRTVGIVVIVAVIVGDGTSGVVVG